jgi:hypothetical protein
LIVGTSHCQPDYVAPGFYGSNDAGMAASASREASSPVRGTSANAVTVTAGSGVDVAAASGGHAAPPSTPHNTDAPSAGVPAAVSSMAGTSAVVAAPPNNRCDLSGRWLITLHLVADGLGQLQTVHTWLYYEIEQQADALRVTKGLQCGDAVNARTALGGNADFHSSWDLVSQKFNDNGRTGTSTSTSAGCQVQLDKWYVIKGATVPHYTDPKFPLPMMNEPASGSTPGWEDWDQDGNPGVTGAISGAISGKIYMTSRTWNVLSGVVADPSHVFKLAADWKQEENVLGYDGSSLLTSQAVRAADATLHFAQLARLGPTQAAAGDDLAICAAIRQLAPMLTPDASAN